MNKFIAFLERLELCSQGLSMACGKLKQWQAKVILYGIYIITVTITTTGIVTISIMQQ